MNVFIYQLKQAYMGLTKKPTLVGNLVFTLGITVGALICALTLTYFMLFKPLPYPDQKQLVLIDNHLVNNVGDPVSKGFSYKQAEFLYEHPDNLKSMALVYNVSDVISSHPLQPNINSAYVTPEWFTLFNTPFALGHAFDQQHGFNQFSPSTIISYQTWQQYFEGREDILEESINIRGVNYQIIGVTAANYYEPEIFSTGRKAEIWLPWDFNWSQQMKWGDWVQVENDIQVVAKLSNMADTKLISHQLTNTLTQAWQNETINSPQYKGWQLNLSFTPLINAIFGEQEKLVFYILFACIGIFIIAIANTANLLLSRTFEQHKLLSICVAMGAKKSSIKSQIFAEILFIAMLSLPVAMVTAAIGFDVMQAQLADLLPRIQELSLGWFAVSSAVLVLAIVSLVFTHICQSTINYKELRQAISSSGKGSGVQIKQSIRRALIISQVAIAMALIFINITLFHNAYRDITSPMGFSVQNSYQLKLAAKDPTRDNDSIRNDLIEIKNRLKEHNAISQVSVSLSPLIWFGQFPVIDATTQQRYVPETKFIDEDYLSILRQPLLRGDNFTREDIRDRRAVVIVNDVFADMLAPNGDVIGKQLDYWGNQHTIIGVVKGIKRPGEHVIPIRRYTPDMGTRPNLMLNLKPEQSLNKEQVLAILNEVTSQYVIYSYDEMVADRNKMLFPQYTVVVITTILTILTIFLAAIGLFGILSYSSQMRRFEIGTRMAIGAKSKDIIHMILRDNVPALVIGISLSSAILLTIFFSFSQILVQYIDTTLIATYTVTLALICSISFMACYLPLRQYIYKPAINSLRGNE